MSAPATHRTIEYERPWLYPKQTEAIFCAERYGVIEASTKSGKTVGCMAWLLEECLKGWEGRSYWWVAPVFPQAKIAYRRMKFGVPRSLYTANESELTIRLAHGGVMWFKSAEKPDNLYGEDVYAAVLDEATRMREDAFTAVRTTLTATRGPVRVIGNVKGRKNWAYRLARRAEAGEPDMHYARITAYDAVQAGVLDEAEIEDARRLLPAKAFRELYEAIPSDDDTSPFGNVRPFIRPLSPKPVRWWGVDLAKAQDWTVLIGLDEDGCVAVFERWQRPWNDTKRLLLSAAVNGAPMLVDSTGVGDPIVEDLQAQRANVEGYLFTLGSKQKLMEGLASAIQQGLLGYPEDVLVPELEAFEYSYVLRGVRYSAPEGMHDDCVCALALAQECRRTHTYAPARLWGGPVSEDDAA